MLHGKTPDQSGWYWVEDDFRAAHMVRLEAEHVADDRTRMLLAMPDRMSAVAMFEITTGKWALEHVTTPTFITRRWIGPIGCPFGEFGENIAEFSIDLHEEAQSGINKDGEVLAMRHVDMKHASKAGGTITSVGRLLRDANIEKWLAVFETA